MDHTAPRMLNRDVFAGLIFLIIAVVFGIEGWRYGLGEGAQAGPGFFPVVLSVMTGVFGILAIIVGLRKRTHEADEPISWRGIVLICASLALFAAAARVLGLVPIVFVCTVLAALASTKNSVLAAILMGAVMSALCYLIFAVGLSISLPTFGTMFGG